MPGGGAIESKMRALLAGSGADCYTKHAFEAARASHLRVRRKLRSLSETPRNRLFDRRCDARARNLASPATRTYRFNGNAKAR